MKAVIPVAGAGVRLRPHTYTQPKPLIPVAGKTIIGFIIDQLHSGGINDFVFITGYLGDKIKNYLDSNYPNINKVYVNQPVQRGIGDAILVAESEIAQEDEFIIMLGDTILDTDLSEFISSPDSCLATQKVKDPRQFGVVEMDKNGMVRKLIEKPSIPKSNLALVGLYKICEVPLFFECLRTLNTKDPQDELQLTDALMMMIEQAVKFRTFEVSHWYDCGKKEILLETNKMLLQKNISDVSTQFVYDHSIIVPPVVYGKSCRFSNAIIGPNVTLGDNVRIENSLIRDSIVGNYVDIRSAALNNSVIGNDALIKGLSQSLNIGDNNEIDFSL